MANTYFTVCPYCGAHLDPGERCDCKESRAIYAKELYDKYYGRRAKRDEGTR